MAMLNKNWLKKTLPVAIAPQRLWDLLLCLVGINLVMLIGTGVFSIYFWHDLGGDWSAGSAIKYLLIQFDLSTENVLAVWYSSLLLLFVCLASGLCFLAESQLRPPKRFPILRYGWLVYTGVFGLLSLDEIGSLHERLGMLHTLNPLGDFSLGWIFLLAPFILLIGAFMLAFSWFHLEDSKTSLLCMILGVVLFVSVPLQEQVEVLWMESWGTNLIQRPLKLLLLEEGTELFGAFMFLVATIAYLNSLATQRSTSRRTANRGAPILEFHLKVKALIYAFLALFIGLGSMMWLTKLEWFFQLSGDTGRPQSWFPGVFAVLSAVLLLLCLSMQRNASSIRYRLEQFLVIFSLAMSIYYGGSLKVWITSAPFPEHSIDDLIYVAVLVTASTLCLYLVSLALHWTEKLTWLGWAAAVDISVFVGDPFQVNLWDFAATAMLVLAVGTHFYYLVQKGLISPMIGASQ